MIHCCIKHERERERDTHGEKNTKSERATGVKSEKGRQK